MVLCLIELGYELMISTSDRIEFRLVRDSKCALVFLGMNKSEMIGGIITVYYSSTDLNVRE